MSKVIRISESIFTRLQEHGVPLVDTPATVIERMLDFFEEHSNDYKPIVNENPPSRVTRDSFKTTSGPSFETGLYLAPANEENLKATIMSTKPLSIAKATLSAKDYDKLKSALKGEEVFKCWAMTKNSLGKFNSMNPGDYVLFTSKGTGNFSFSGRVIFKVRNEELGSLLWSVVPNLPWELIYFLEDINFIKVPKDKLVSSLGYDPGYVVPGIIRVSAERVRGVVKQFGSIPKFISSLENQQNGLSTNCPECISIINSEMAGVCKKCDKLIYPSDYRK